MNQYLNINNVEFNVDLITVLEDLHEAMMPTELFSRGFNESGDNVMLQCPYHNDGKERRPSAGIHKVTGIFHCFACGKTVTLPEFISNCLGYDDGGLYGWKWLLKNYVSISLEDRRDVKLDFERYMPVISRHLGNNDVGVDNNKNKVCCTYVSEEELDSYRYIHPYMYERGLTDEIIELFDIGYDKSRRCITFPVRDIEGNCLFVARRSVDYKYFNYPKGVEKPLYGLYEIRKVCTYDYDMDYIVSGDRIKGPRVGDWHSFPNDVIVCESMLDALSFWTVSKCAVALNGLGSELQFKQLRELPCRKIILATDMDERGLSARKRIRNELKNIKIVSDYYFPEGRKDANECTKEELKNLKDILV